jgi:hypothetical protein
VHHKPDSQIRVASSDDPPTKNSSPIDHDSCLLREVDGVDPVQRGFRPIQDTVPYHCERLQIMGTRATLLTPPSSPQIMNNSRKPM